MNSTVTRSLSGIVFIGLLLASLLIHPLGFGLIFCIIMLIGLREFYKMVLPSINNSLAYVTAFLLFTLVFANAYVANIVPSQLLYLLVVPLFALFIVALYQFKEQPFNKLALQFLGLFYVALPFTLFNCLTFIDTVGNFEYKLILSLFLFLWANDVGAYCIGMLFGRHGKHKLFERISPNKSWEGFWGGLFFSQLTAVIIAKIWGDFNFPSLHWFVLALIITITGTYGDLIESMLKRSVGVKDSGHIMPGHGGVLDRFDGALLAFPCALAYLKIIELF